MTGDGEPEVVADGGGARCWDGRRLPGPGLVANAIGQAVARATEHGTAAVAIRRSHHIACLAAYPERATAKGRMILSPTPSAASRRPIGWMPS
jgi:LDH2 family malate/lactate/ureidoglycolate dehydrogenase